MDIAQQPPLLPVQPVAIAVVIAAAATVMIVIRPTPRQAALAEVVEAVAVVPAAVQSLAGQNRDFDQRGFVPLLEPPLLLPRLPPALPDEE